MTGASGIEVFAVFMDAEHVGFLYNQNPLSFNHENAWLTNLAAQALVPVLVPNIPLQGGRIDTAFIHAFFENLLLDRANAQQDCSSNG